MWRILFQFGDACHLQHHRNCDVADFNAEQKWAAKHLLNILRRLFGKCRTQRKVFAPDSWDIDSVPWDRNVDAFMGIDPS